MSGTSDCSSNKRRINQIDDGIENLTQEINSLNDFVYRTELECSLMTVRVKREKLKALSAFAKAQAMMANMQILVAEGELYTDIERLKNIKRMRLDLQTDMSQKHTQQQPPTQHSTATLSEQITRGTSEKDKYRRPSSHSSSRKTPPADSSSRKTPPADSSSRKTSVEKSSSRKTSADKSSSRKTSVENSSSRKTLVENSSSRKTLVENSSSRKASVENSSLRSSPIDIFAEETIIIPSIYETTKSLVGMPQGNFHLGLVDKTSATNNCSEVSHSSSDEEFNHSFAKFQTQEPVKQLPTKNYKSDTKVDTKSKTLKTSSASVSQQTQLTLTVADLRKTISKHTSSSTETVCTPMSRSGEVKLLSCMPIRHKNLPQLVPQRNTSAITTHINRKPATLTNSQKSGNS